MSNKLEAYLILGCCGFSDKGFLFCHSLSNPIIDLEQIDPLDYDKVLNFFDSACGLFDKPIYDRNKLSNVLNMLYEFYSLISKDELYHIQNFINMHKRCGLYLMLMMKEDYKHGQ